KKAIQIVTGNEKIAMVCESIVDSGRQKEQLEKDLEYQRGFLASVEKKLSNERFVNNAKPEVVALERKKQADAIEKIRTLEESLKAL
ncbi:MAG: hypothetical protein H3C36_13095, partial [Chitinophagaceae bacterium]|nr:hypothetical protein [Chitinophagaceae bacterium]